MANPASNQPAPRPVPADNPGAEKRRSQRVALRVPVVVLGTDRHGKPFGEVTSTVIVNAHGGLVEIKAELNDGQRVLLRNKLSGDREPCRVVWFTPADAGKFHAGLEFLTPAPKFWRVDFPPEDWKIPMMRAAQLKEMGGAISVDEIPRPAALPDEVLIKVEACGICHSDLHMARGEWPEVARAMSLPAVLGHEAVGRIIECGAAVKHLKVGQRVGVGWLYSVCGECEHCRSGSENICSNRKITSVAAPGGYAEYMRIRATHALPVPDGLAPEQAAPLFCAGLTVFHACRMADLYSGQRVAVFGIGGLGHLAVQLALNAGCEVIAVDVSEAKLELARKLGVVETVNTGSPDARQMLRIDGGPHVAIVTAAAKQAYDLAFKSIRRKGTLVVVGLPKEDLTFFADDLVVSECKILGSAVGTRDETNELLLMAAAGKIRCEVETVRLDQVNDVYSRMLRGELHGRAVIKM